MRVFWVLDFDVEVVPSPTKTLTLANPVLIFTGFSSQRPHPMGVEDGFSNMNLGYAPLHFPNLSEEEKSTI